jgi:hypothetical protein
LKSKTKKLINHSQAKVGAEFAHAEGFFSGDVGGIFNFLVKGFVKIFNDTLPWDILCGNSVKIAFKFGNSAPTPKVANPSVYALADTAPSPKSVIKTMKKNQFSPHSEAH